jgi:glycopeptide antibiotics resistance protein
MPHTRRYTKIIFTLYCIILVWILLFKLSLYPGNISALFGMGRSVNLIPFYYPAETGFHAREVLLNGIIFVPFGLLLCMLGAGFKKASLIALSVSAALEVCQFALAFGACDVTDLITNTLGAIVGAGVYLMLRKMCKNRQKLDKTLLILGTCAAAAFFTLTVLLTLAN